MKLIITKFLSIVIISLSFSISSQNIKRRGSLGVQLKKIETHVLGREFAIAQIFPKSTAESVGLKVNDIILDVNNKEVKSYEDLKMVIADFYMNDFVSILVLRNGKKKKLKGQVIENPPPKLIETSETILGEVPFKNGHIRSIINKPKGQGPFPAFYYIQGYPCQSVSYGKNHPTSKLLSKMLERGYLIYRVEKPGVGEYSKCLPCQQQKFNDEELGFNNGLKELLKLPYVDSSKVYVFGHSLGGNIAPSLSYGNNITGIITYGTIIKPWTEYLLDMARYSSPLVENNFENISSKVSKLRAINNKIYFEGLNIESLSDEEKKLLVHLNDYDEKRSVFNRTIDFWKEYNTIDFFETWANTTIPTLSLYGESDIHAISSLDAEYMTCLINSKNPGLATFKEIPGTDHLFAKVESKTQEAALIRTGRINQVTQTKFNSELPDILINWINDIEAPKQKKIFQDASELIDIDKTLMSTMDVVAEDLDNDGDQDIILATEFGPNRVFFNSKNKFSEDPQRLLPMLKDYKYPYLGEDSEDIAVADFNNDGIKDLFFVSEDTENHELLYGLGNGKFEFAKQQIPKIGQANAVLVFDFDSNGFKDILIGIRGQNELYLNKDGTTFSRDNGLHWPKNIDSTQDLIIVDIDGDKDLDIVEGIEDGGNNIYINDGNRFKEDKNRLPDMSMVETRKVVHGDIDNDGDADLFFCNVGWQGKNPQNILLINDGHGVFSIAPKAIPKDTSTTLDAIIQDFNGDGKVDILTTGLNEINNLKLLINKSSRDGINFENCTQCLPNLSYNGGISIAVVSTGSDSNEKGLGIYLGNHNFKDFFLNEN